jgi:predicted O-linked N-acetylglucosamine transferase (SPINDLY family)
MRKHIRPHPNDRDPKRRLRVGYVSTDFNAHPVGKFLLPLFVGHDKQGFEIFAYAQVRMEDEVTQQLRSHADVWRNIIGLSDLQVAERIRRAHRRASPAGLCVQTGSGAGELSGISGYHRA